MSYDLMVFDPNKAPTSKNDFLKWYENLVLWEEGHSYNDISITNTALTNWYREMLLTFPSMNGPDALSDEEIDKLEENDEDNILTDYCISKDAIYIAFSWSKQEHAYQTVTALAKKHGVGFFDVSGRDGDIIFPDISNSQIKYTMYTNFDDYDSGSFTTDTLNDILHSFTFDTWNFIVLTPSIPINGYNFIQVGAPSIKTDFKFTIETSINNGENVQMYRYYTDDLNEAFEILKAFYEIQQTPNVSQWEDITSELPTT